MTSDILNQMTNHFPEFHLLLNDLTPKVREKAIEIALELLANGQCPDKQSAITEGIRQAEEWFMDLEG
mgnify:CR=1 FL=1